MYQLTNLPTDQAGMDNLRDLFIRNYKFTGLPHYLFVHFDLWRFQIHLLAKTSPGFFRENARVWWADDQTATGFLYSETGEQDFSLVVDHRHGQLTRAILAWITDNWKPAYRQLSTCHYTYLDDTVLLTSGFRKDNRLAACLEFDLPGPTCREPAGYPIESIAQSKKYSTQYQARMLCFADNPGPVTTKQLELYTCLRQAPCYREEFDLYILLDNQHVSSCLILVEPAQKAAVIESVCTLPAYRRRGLASAMIRHALYLLQAQGYRKAYLYSETGYTYHLYKSLDPAREHLLYAYKFDRENQQEETR